MAKTNTAPFAQTEKTGTAELTAASVITTDTPTNTLLLFTAGSDGALFTQLGFTPRATVTATACYLFTSDDSGSTKMLEKSVLMEAHTVAATTAIPTTDFGYTESAPLRLEAGEELYVSIGVALASGVVAVGRGTDF